MFRLYSLKSWESCIEDDTLVIESFDESAVGIIGLESDWLGDVSGFKGAVDLGDAPAAVLGPATDTGSLDCPESNVKTPIEWVRSFTAGFFIPFN